MKSNLLIRHYWNDIDDETSCFRVEKKVQKLKYKTPKIDQKVKYKAPKIDEKVKHKKAKIDRKSKIDVRKWVNIFA